MAFSAPTLFLWQALLTFCQAPDPESCRIVEGVADCGTFGDLSMQSGAHRGLALMQQPGGSLLQKAIATETLGEAELQPDLASSGTMEPASEPESESESESESEAEEEEEHENESEGEPSTPGSSAPTADAARAEFLMQATFGPTLRELQLVREVGYSQYVKGQISLPYETHRQFYRRYSNPAQHRDGTAGSSRSACATGSRWHSTVFTKADEGKRVQVTSAGILVDGQLRSKIIGGSLPSEWQAKEGFNGWICKAIDGVGGDVWINTRQDCRRRTDRNDVFHFMQNGLILKGDAKELSASLTEVSSGRAVLASTMETCDLVPRARFIEIRRPLSVGTGGGRHHLHLCDVKVYSSERRQVKLSFANASSQVAHAWSKEYKPTQAIDEHDHTCTHNQAKGVEYGAEDHWMKFWLDDEAVDVLSVEILFRSHIDRAYGVQVRLFDETDKEVSSMVVDRKDFDGAFWTGKVEPGFIKANNKIWHFDDRVALEENTPESPSRHLDACVLRSPVNERTCKFQHKEAQPGFSFKIQPLYDRSFPAFITDSPPGRLVEQYVESQVDHVSSSFAIESNYTAQWTGTLKITVEGEYDFWVTSDSGRRLYLDGELVVRSDVGQNTLTNMVEGTCDETLHGPKDASYRGCQTVTKSGKPCQRWDAQDPQKHDRTPANYPDKGLTENYCRNPDGEDTIWCYTTDPGSRWEHCTPIKNTEDGGIDDGHNALTSRVTRRLASGSHALRVEIWSPSGPRSVKLEWSGPDTADRKQVLPSSAVTTRRWREHDGCALACGSPGEGANDPAVGHHYPFMIGGSRVDMGFDDRYAGFMEQKFARSTVWVMRALKGQDQLRQRMAWALSQIMVVSLAGLPKDEETEVWLNYYDIFVRNAFGNFKDILREVTYSPAMGTFLTHTGSSSYDFNGRYPNENYAREVMQLFSIGLFKMTRDGTMLKDGEGNPLATYDNSNILAFSRIFTGFEYVPPRKNIEVETDGTNHIDPMIIDARKRDVYPKPNLNDHYIGDGLPVCSELTARGFLSKGARYEVQPELVSAQVVLSSNSALYQTLCGTTDGAAPCAPKLWTELEETLPCTGAECEMTSASFVEVDGYVFKFHLPRCVHLLYLEPTMNASAEMAAKPIAGSCEAAHGQHLGQVRRLDSLGGNDEARRHQCINACLEAGAKGCELDYSSSTPGCYAYMLGAKYLDISREASSDSDLNQMQICDIQAFDREGNKVQLKLDDSSEAVSPYMSVDVKIVGSVARVRNPKTGRWMRVGEGTRPEATREAGLAGDFEVIAMDGDTVAICEVANNMCVGVTEDGKSSLREGPPQTQANWSLSLFKVHPLPKGLVGLYNQAANRWLRFTYSGPIDSPSRGDWQARWNLEPLEFHIIRPRPDSGVAPEPLTTDGEGVIGNERTCTHMGGWKTTSDLFMRFEILGDVHEVSRVQVVGVEQGRFTTAAITVRDAKLSVITRHVLEAYEISRFMSDRVKTGWTSPDHTALTCPDGSEQVGMMNADIFGCGLGGDCSKRYGVPSSEACRDRCNLDSQCRAFTWAPLGGDDENLGDTVCTMYAEVAPDSLAGPRQIMCTLSEELWSLPDPRMKLDASKQATEEVVDSVSNLRFGSRQTTEVDGVRVWDLDDAYLSRTAGDIFKVAQRYTQCTWIQWRDHQDGWATLFRGSSDHAVLVYNSNRELGVFSNRNGNWRSSGYKITRGIWQFVCAVGEGGSPTSYHGTTTFYVGNLSESPQKVGTADRVVSGTEVRWIGLNGQGPGKLASFQHWQAALTEAQLQDVWKQSKPQAAVEEDTPDGYMTYASNKPCLPFANKLDASGQTANLQACVARCNDHEGCSYMAFCAGCAGNLSDQCMMYASCVPRDLQVQGFSIFAKRTVEQVDNNQDDAADDLGVNDGVLMHINAEKQAGTGDIQDRKAKMTWRIHGRREIKEYDGVKAWNLDSSWLQRQDGEQWKVPGESTMCAWVMWRKSNNGWRTLFRGDADHAQIVYSGRTELGFYSSRAGGWRGSGTEIVKGEWQFICSVSTGDARGRTRFYVGSVGSPPKEVAKSADRSPSGTSVFRIGWPGQGPGKLHSFTVWDKAFKTDFQAVAPVDLVKAWNATMPANAIAADAGYWRLWKQHPCADQEGALGSADGADDLASCAAACKDNSACKFFSFCAEGGSCTGANANVCSLHATCANPDRRVFGFNTYTTVEPLTATHKLQGAEIALFNQRNNRWLSVTKEATVRGDDRGDYEISWAHTRFEMVDAGENQIALRNLETGRWVQVSSNGQTSAPTSGPWEGLVEAKFRVLELDGGKIALWNPASRRWLRITHHGVVDAPSRTNFEHFHHGWTWEVFTPLVLKVIQDPVPANANSAPDSVLSPTPAPTPEAPARTDVSCWLIDREALKGHTGFSYVITSPKSAGCPDTFAIDSLEECRAALEQLGFAAVGESWTGARGDIPTGCSWDGTRAHYNTQAAGAKGGRPGWRSVCRMHVTVNAAGDVVQHDGTNPFPVHWASGSAEASTHMAEVAMEQVFFDQMPSEQDVLQLLHVGAYDPSTASPPIPCFVCDGSLKAYHPDRAAIDAQTIFELHGKFFKNTKSVVKLPGGKSFRNPPVFQRPTTVLENNGRTAMDEVEELLDHLFHHQNCPVFVGTRLIQRFGYSTPTRAYTREVGDAFTSGKYGEDEFSGKRGDLEATVSAVLLHAGAREHMANVNPGTQGSLREPFMKFIHMMRSMEYRDADSSKHEKIVFTKLQNMIGQFPFEAPSVFNYYLADYDLPSMDIQGPEGESEPESEEEELEEEEEEEPEPESESEEEEMEEEEGEEEEGEEEESEEEEEEEEQETQTDANMGMDDESTRLLVSPELQVLTPMYMIGYLNAMSTLVRVGVTGSQCGDGFEHIGIDVFRYKRGDAYSVCPKGRFEWHQDLNDEDSVEMMNLLLTGGRLSSSMRETVARAYADADSEEKVSDAQMAIALSAEFNSFGKPLSVEHPRTLPQTDTRPPVSSYKAVVMLFLSGGADTFNMLVPICEGLYKEYEIVRTDLVLTNDEMIPVETIGQDTCNKFGVHNRFPFIVDLYNAGDAAFVSNVGNLVEPLTKPELQRGLKRRCNGLFSHSNQQNGAQTTYCQVNMMDDGAGGRIADALKEGLQKYSTASWSLDGDAVFSKGAYIKRDVVGAKPERFQEYEKWHQALLNVTTQQHRNPYTNVYTLALADALKITETLIQMRSVDTIVTDYPACGGLCGQLREVARIIGARAGRRAERDVFFVQTGGFDMHSNMKMSLDRRFNDINRDLMQWVAEIKAQGIWSNVTLFTSSEFARTLDSNGGGSDHGYSGNHFLIGGALKGGRIFNQFPESLLLGARMDLGRGRLIPDYPWESFLVPLAQWMGVEDGWLAHAFPNLVNFNTTKHIIPFVDLFDV